ncbi:hypothetical protein FF125_08620 [Aureibaculum algae]|uniref:Calcium-binding protein n=1 Tax=Aureibaculum algae TaxID=2584122 RepID=A0A5B7TNN0_9FLAO|nr:hypothetical protein [Aureibaculum algae]QCX38489.1 hypothetical protein FF125_08620 [Aureibaculum algae]
MSRIYLFFLLILVLSCDDGSLDIPEFDFSSIDIETCGEVVLFKINENETFVIELDSDLNDDETFLTYKWEEETFTVSGSGTNSIAYRTMSEAPTSSYFCQNIPPTSPTVTQEWTGTGTVLVNTEFSEDDNDGVDETDDLLLDTDGDGIPNYIDSDDDGDDITTKNEDIDGDGDPTNDDTDGDGIPNYLDANDDGDSVDTINESTTLDANGNDIVDYLDPDTSSTITEQRNLQNSYVETYKTTITISPLKLVNENGEPINYDSYEFGTIETSKTIIPE